MQHIIHVIQRDLIKLLLIAVFFILIQAPAGTAGEYGGTKDMRSADTGYLSLFARDTDRTGMFLSYDGGGAGSAEGPAGARGRLSHKLGGFVEQCVKYFSCRGSRVQLNAFNIRAGSFDTSLNAVYNHEKEEVEIGMGMTSDSLTGVSEIIPSKALKSLNGGLLPSWIL